MSKMKATYGEPKDNYSAKIRIKSTVLVIWFIILTVICLLPIYILIINATREHKDIANSLSFIPGTHFFKNLETINTNPTMKMAYDAFHGYKNSLIITVLSCFLTVFFSAMTSYGIHVYDFKLKDISYTVILLVMMVPMQVTSAGFVSFMADLHLTNTKIPLILPAIAAPSVVYFNHNNNVFTAICFILVQDPYKIPTLHFSLLYSGVVLQPFFIFHDLDIFKRIQPALLYNIVHLGLWSFAFSRHRTDVLFSVCHVIWQY